METFSCLTELTATAQHIVVVQRKLDTLAAARDDSWSQLLVGAARAYQAGRINDIDLLALLNEMKASYGPGYTRLWNTVMPWSSTRVPHRAADAVRNPPNSADGTHWLGPFPAAGGQPHPRDRVPVVYVFYDALHEPVYVGSTERFLVRMKQHQLDPTKQCVRSWMASPCTDREDAYLLEEKLLAEHQPRLNKRQRR